MKMAKKVLSVVLAVVMALSCFAVAGSAFGPSADVATKHAKIVLKAAVGSSKFICDEAQDYADVFEYADPETEKASEVTAKAGDTVYIYVYGDTDYYVHSFFAEVFYPSIFKTPSDCYNDSLIAIDPEFDRAQEISKADKKAIFFGNSPLIQSYGLVDNCYFCNEWFVFPDATKNDVASSWPTDANGDIIDGFGSGKTPSTDWSFMRFGLIVPSSDPDPIKMNAATDTYTYRLPLYIPEGTPDGTYTVTVPEQAAAQASKVTGVTKIGEVATTYNKLKKVDKIDSPVKTLLEVDKDGTIQNFDFSQATVTITVGEEAPELSWDNLATAYAGAPKDNNDGTYTAASWDDSGIETALASAAAELNETTGHKCTTQDAIDDLETALTDAIDALEVKANYTDLDAALVLAEGILDDPAKYEEDDNWTEFEAKYEAALEVDKDLSEEYQEDINNAASELETAIANLTPHEELADYLAYDEAVIAANVALTHDTWYTEESFAALENAMGEYGNLDRNLKESQQKTVNDATNAILSAISGLEEVKAKEYEDLADLIGTYKWQMTNGTLKKADYTEASWENFTDALADADLFNTQTNYTQQQEDENGYVTNAISALTGAHGGLNQAGTADYDELEALIDEFYELNEAAYTEDSWGAVVDYIENEIDYNLNENFQDTIDDEYIPTLQGLIEDLVFEEFTITYTYVDDKGASLTGVGNDSAPTSFKAYDDIFIDKGFFTKEGYTPVSISSEGWRANTTTGDQTVTVVFSKNEIPKHDITYTYVDEDGNPVTASTTNPTTYEEGSAVTFDTSKFFAESANYEFASVDPTSISADSKTDVEVIVTFKLKDADYSALDALIKTAEAKKEYQYTAESWGPFAKALADAKSVETGLKITDQKVIDDAKDALNKAMEALVIAVNGSVFDVQFEATGVNKVQATVKVMGRAMMVQFQELSNGGTRSYDRHDIDIVSYDKDGNVVADTSKDLAYEIWTINTRFDGPEMGVRVKNNGSSTWETPDEAYKFTYEKDIAVISAELASESGAQGAVMATVVTGSEVVYLQFKMDDGSTATLGADKASTDEDGNLVFTGKAFMNHEGKNVITIRVYDGAKWTTSETTLEYTAEAKK